MCDQEFFDKVPGACLLYSWNAAGMDFSHLCSMTALVYFQVSVMFSVLMIPIAQSTVLQDYSSSYSKLNWLLLNTLHNKPYRTGCLSPIDWVDSFPSKLLLQKYYINHDAAKKNSKYFSGNNKHLIFLLYFRL